MKKIERIRTIPHFFHDNTIEVEELSLNEQEAYIEQLERAKEELITAYKELLLYDAVYLYGYAPYDKRVEEYFAGEIELLEKLTGKTLVELKEERG